VYTYFINLSGGAVKDIGTVLGGMWTGLTSNGGIGSRVPLNINGDTLGRLNIVTSIDRLATPASRKQTVSSAAKPRDSGSSVARPEESLPV
jgi:hypothetical protein